MDAAKLDPGSPALAAAALDALRFRDLLDEANLDALLALCASEAPIPGQTEAAADPFAAFFGDAAPVREVTLGERACARLAALNVPATEASLATLVRHLKATPASKSMIEALVPVVTQARWENADQALRMLAPALVHHDIPLFPLIVHLKGNSLGILAEAAARRPRLRTLNELMNHEPAREDVPPAIVAALEAGLRPSDHEAADLLNLLAAWNASALLPAARRLLADHPWAQVYLAMEEAEAAAAFEAALVGGLQVPSSVAQKVDEVLASRATLEPFPLMAWIRARNRGVKLLRAFEQLPSAAAWLETRAKAVVTDPDDEEGWRACEALGELDRLDAQPWLEQLLMAPLEVPDSVIALLGAGAPAQAIADALPQDSRRVDHWGAALLRTGSAEHTRQALTAAIEAAEAVPRTVSPPRKGVVCESTPGWKIEGLEALVQAVGDAELTSRHQALLPVFRGA